MDTTEPQAPTTTLGVEPTALETRLDDTTARTEIRHRYPHAAFRGPLFEAHDRLALAMAAVMLIGPLAALPLGF
jgi:hypothetical protein